MNTIGIISLGCARNLVDSEIISGVLKERGFTVLEIDQGVDIAIVNTCGFIKDAKEESIDIILQASHLKREGKLKYLIVAGCLSQRYAEKLKKELPEVDSFVGTGDFLKIPEIVDRLSCGKKISAVSKIPKYLYSPDTPKIPLTPRHYAYIKISEGCSNRCSYCVIPQLRGRLRSRSIQSIVQELRALPHASALREINIIGQDITSYGVDLNRRSTLTALLKKVVTVNKNVGWVRLLYTHPAHYTKSLIDLIAGEPKICKYLDIPIQHINDNILQRMHRRITKAEIASLIDRVRKRIPHLALRTSVIVGFPGETEEEFRELLDFLKEVRFERLGAFIYSREEGTKAYRYKKQIPEKVKAERFDEIMKTQRDLSRGHNFRLMGKECVVLIDEKREDVSLGRTEWDAPEVDGTVHIRGGDVSQGEFRKVRIIDTLEYDLVGEVIP